MCSSFMMQLDLVNSYQNFKQFLLSKNYDQIDISQGINTDKNGFLFGLCLNLFTERQCACHGLKVHI